MLENRKNVRKKVKVIMIIIALILAVGLYINESIATSEQISVNGGTVKPIYKPEWEKVSSTLDTTNKKLTVKVKGSAQENNTSTGVDTSSGININYASDVTSTLAPEDIIVFVDGVEVTSTTNPQVQVSAGTESTNATTTKKEITHEITLSNLEEAIRQTGIPYKEWSGNISIKIAGRGKDESTYDKDVLTDSYGNQNMMETDQNGTNADGTWIDINFKDGEIKENTDGIMFIDFVKPEFTYRASETIIGNGNNGNTKKVTVVFEVVDKYFENTTLAAEDITIKLIDTTPETTIDPDHITKTLTKTHHVIRKADGTLKYEEYVEGTDYVLQTGETKIGIKYQLLIEGLEQRDANGLSDGYTYSGPMSIGFSAGKVTDFSDNSNAATTITIGVDETDGNQSTSLDYTRPYLPDGYTIVRGTSLATGLTIQDSLGNQYVWIEVPKTTTVYATAGINLNLSSLNATDLTNALNNIETDLNNYAAAYGEKQGEDSSLFVDIYSSEEATGLTSTQYNELKKNMLISVYENGGFYIGRYETGATTVRTSEGDTTQQAVIKQNVYPYNLVTRAQAQGLASGFANTGYTSSLLFGVQWNLVLKYLETKGTPEADLNSDASNWGNNLDYRWTITNTEAEYSRNNINWTPITSSFKKTSAISYFLTTGASEKFKKQNIYDLQGNFWELLLEYTSNPNKPVSMAGQQAVDPGVAADRYNAGIGESGADENVSFRVTLFKKGVATADELIDVEKLGQVVDVVDPAWELVNANLDAQSITIRGKDKYFKESLLDEDKITIYVNGVESEIVEKTLATPIYKKLDGGGNYVTTTEPEEAVAIEYVLQLSNITLNSGEYTEFEPKKLDGNGTMVKDEEIVGTPKYRSENGGSIVMKIAAGTLKDDFGNANKATTLDVGTMDSTNPETYKVDVIKDNSTKKATIIFNVTDRNYDPSDPITLGATPELSLWIDNINQTENIKIDSFTSKEIKANVDNTLKVLGHQYTIVLSEFDETQEEFIEAYADGREYRELSGTLEIRIEPNASKDLNGNTINPDAATVSEHIDFINPEINYEYSESSQGNPGDINYEGKTFTMIFEVLDKYIAESTLKNELDDINTQLADASKTAAQKQALAAERKELIDTFFQDNFEILIDTQTIDWTKVERDLTIEDVEATTAFNKTVGGTVVNDNHVIGYKYTLVFSNLEQLQIQGTDQYVNYSGVITTAIEANIVKDTLNNGNVATTITSGIDIIGNVQQPGTGQIVDVADPVWVKVSSSANAIDPANTASSTATIKVRGTDKYYASSTLTDKIKVWAQSGTEGADPTDITESVTITVDETVTPVYKTGTTDVQVGDEYTITVTGFAQDINQLKVEILEDAMLDQSGNGNKATTFIIYNVLRLTNTETSAMSAFLGQSYETSILPSNTVVTAIQRQQIEKVIFTNSIQGSTVAGVQRIWDVSAAEDKSIIAWTSQSAAPYTVYVGSNDEIFANQDSRYLLSYIGYAETCTASTTVEGFALLNENSVTNMAYMFNNFGHRKMSALSLGEFDTKYVTNMEGMFNGCGQLQMQTFSLGTKFNTSKVQDMSEMFQNLGNAKLSALSLGSEFYTSEVTDMANMFNGCAQTEITTFTLGEHFNTAKVTKMNGMFQNFGTGKLQALSLGSNFYTSEVTDMSDMFNGCGTTAMATLQLGVNFNTTKVQYMNGMFQNCGTTALTSLDLGDLFYTTAVTNMSNMFNGCGTTAMTTLDLGPAFTKISSTRTDFAKDLGKAGEITIYAPESIYASKTAFKLGTTSTTTINLDVIDDTTDPDTYRGEIIPRYKPEWTIDIDKKGTEATTDDEKKVYMNTGTGTLSVTVRGSAYKTGIYASDVTSTLAKEDIKVYFDGVEVTSTTNPQIVVNAGEEETNATSTKKEITHTIVLSNLQEAVRQTSPAELRYREWSGNIKIKILGRGKASSTYSGYVLKDSYGNQAMMETDESGTNADGSWIDITYSDIQKDKNTAQNAAIATPNITATTPVYMFADFIKPEFTYRDSNTVIDYGAKTVTVYFDITDKYFNNSQILTDTFKDNLITIKIGDTTVIGDKNGDGVVNRGEDVNHNGILDSAEDINKNGVLDPGEDIGNGQLDEGEDTNGNGVLDPGEDIGNGILDSSEDLDADGILDEVDENDREDVGTVLTKEEDLYYTVNGDEEHKVGERYKLVISKIQQSIIDASRHSGTLTLGFAAGIAEDTSGNANNATTITLGINETDGDNADGGDGGSATLVDVVDPIIKYNSSQRNNDGTITVTLRAEDKYLTSEKLVELKNTVKVKIKDEYGNVIVNDTSTITKEIEKIYTASEYILFRVTLSNFGIYEGMTSLIIPADVIIDSSNNGNIETEILVGNPSDTSEFKNSVVDFTKPIWEYVTSSIDRDWDDDGDPNTDDRRLENGEIDLATKSPDGTVTIEVKGTDIYFAGKYLKEEENQLNLDYVKVYINGTENTEVDVNFATNADGTIKKEYYEETRELATGYSRVLKGVKYTLVLSDFGTNEGSVKIEIPQHAIMDTSFNGNDTTTIFVGNPEWIETDVEEDPDNPIYTAFRPVTDATGAVIGGSIVDYIKPVIQYKYEEGNVNPKLYRDLDKEYVDIIFTATDTNFYSSDIGVDDLKIFIDDMQVYGAGANNLTKIQAQILTPTEAITDPNNGLKYTLRLSNMEQNGYIEDLNNNKVLDEGEDINENGQLDKFLEVFERHSGVIKIVFAEDQVVDTSGNKNNETTIIIDNDDGDSQADGVIVDYINPNIYYQDKYINWQDNYTLITLRATDRFYVNENDNIIEVSDLTLYEEYETADGSIDYRNITNRFTGKMSIQKSSPLYDDKGNIVGYDYTLKLQDFQEEFKMRIDIPAGVIKDTSDNYNDAYSTLSNTSIEVDLDNKKPSWNYVNTSTSTEEGLTNFMNNGIITFDVKGVDKFLNLTNSELKVEDIIIIKDGQPYLNGAEEALKEAPDVPKIQLSTATLDEEEKSISYTITLNVKNDITGEIDIGTYSIVIAKDTLIDEFGNLSAATTISFSKSAIAPNTENYRNVTYHITPDMENVHKSFVHELMSVNVSGTNANNETFRPSTIGEIHNNGQNPLFAEPMYRPQVNGYTVTQIYEPKSFAGWAESDEAGNEIYYTDATLTEVSETKTTFTKVYGLYDEIPIPESVDEEIHLKAVWQKATVVFVSASQGSTSNDGKLPTTPVPDLATAFSKIDAGGTSTSNVIVIMDAVTFDSTTTLTGNATITSLYAGVDYRQGTPAAELKLTKNMIVDGDIIFDNIELYADTTEKLISNYSGDITLGRRVTTPTGKYTFESIIGGNYDTETSTGELGTHKLRVEAGRYNNIYAGSDLTTRNATPTTKSVTHEVIIGNMRDTSVSRNDKLTITGTVAIGKNEQKTYPTGATTTNAAAEKDYANITLYSGTFTTGSQIYLRSINGLTDGIMNFEMYGGNVTGDIYGGSRISASYGTQLFNTMNFYGGQLTGNLYGQGKDDTFTGSTDITLQGIFTMTGNIYGGSNRTAVVAGDSVGSGNSKIIINSSSVTVNGNIYGGGNAPDGSTGYVTGTTNIILKLGTVSNIYGSGYNCGTTGQTTISVENGAVSGNIFGGAYKAQSKGRASITVLGGAIGGNIYGGDQNTTQTEFENDGAYQNVNITIGDIDPAVSPTITGNIYGGGQFDKVETATIDLIESANRTSVFGGSNTTATTVTANINLNGMTVNEIYGGSHEGGNVAVSNIKLILGTANEVYGGGYKAPVAQATVSLEGASVTSIYGGSNTSGTVDTSNVTLKSGSLVNVFGGGNSAPVGTTNVTLDGITIDTIYGGSKDAGAVTTSNVILTSGNVTNVFGGGLDVSATTTNINQSGPDVTVTNIYGGSNAGTGDGGETGTTNIDIKDATVANIYGGNKDKGITTTTNINIHGTSTVTGNIFGGGYKTDIGKEDATGSTTINIAGGTINGDINGGSELSKVYGTTNINIGQDVTVLVNNRLTPGSINIKGIIYGAGTTEAADKISVVGETHIFIDNSDSSPITYYTADGKEKSIYGSGKDGSMYSKVGTYDKSTIDIKDLGTADSIYLLKSIENTGRVSIGNSAIEIIGARATNGHYYSLNTIINALTIYDNTTLYTQRGFNKVGGFNSYTSFNTTLGTGVRATATISGTEVETNTNNRLYTLQGINLIFAKKEVNLSNKSTLTQEEWGEVNGMTFFGMYRKNAAGTREYGLYAPDFDYATGGTTNLFDVGTYVEGQHKTGHVITTDGFYTNVVDETTSTVIPEIIQTTDYYGRYYDWIINAPIVNHEVDLIASAYGEQSVAELLMNHQYAKGAEYTLNKVSLNALKPGIELVDPTDPTQIPLIATEANANTKFGLTMETTKSGWFNNAVSKIYTADNGSVGGDEVYKSDTSTTAGTIKFQVHNSLNITESKDLGTVELILVGLQPIGVTGVEGNTFIVVIAVNLQALAEELREDYVPSFTDRAETELNYTTDSRIDLSYTLYKDYVTTPYQTGDYRVLSSTIQFPAGTRITLKDYGQGGTWNKTYYYHVTATTPFETETITGPSGDVTRYIYNLSEFIEMATTNAKYANSNSTYFHNTYVLEKYDISIDFIDSNLNADKIAQETYLELRHTENGTTVTKYSNGETEIKYSLYTNKNAIFSETITNEGSSYSVVEDLEIPFTLTASLLEQGNVIDTKYREQIAGIAIDIVDKYGDRINSPELQNFKLINVKDTTEVYEADANGVIRIPTINGLGSKATDYKLTVTQANVPYGVYTVRVKFYTADDGKYFGTVPAVQKTFNITFINKVLGLIAVEADADTRIISKETGKNLSGTTGIDMTVKLGDPTNETNLRVELYKRNKTYNDLTDEQSYTGTSYTLVNINEYLQAGLTKVNGTENEYMVLAKQTYEPTPELLTIDFEKALGTSIKAGEYKLVFKSYNDDTLVQTVSKTFIVTP